MAQAIEADMGLMNTYCNTSWRKVRRVLLSPVKQAAGRYRAYLEGFMMMHRSGNGNFLMGLSSKSSLVLWEPPSI